MFTSTFTFAKGQYDDDFHALDAVIAEVARAIPGYLGEEAWENTETGLISNVYYWDSMDALQARWLKGYQVVIAQVVRSYGDKGIPHPLA